MTAITASTDRARIRVPVLVKICIVVFVIIAITAIIGPWVAPMDPNLQNVAVANSGPSASHLLGTDALGRDIVSRIIVGTGSAFFGPLVIAIGSFILGNLLGLVAGYRGGWTDTVVMRWVDLMWSIPTLLVLIVIAGAYGSGYWMSVGILLVLSVPFDTRVVRGATLEQMPRPYVEAAKTIGLSTWRIMTRHVWPNVASVAVANAFLVFAGALVALAGLSFLGLGVPPGTPDWGLMIAENQALLFANPYATLVPAALVAILALVMTVVGDWIDESLRARSDVR